MENEKKKDLADTCLQRRCLTIEKAKMPQPVYLKQKNIRMLQRVLLHSIHKSNIVISRSDKARLNIESISWGDIEYLEQHADWDCGCWLCKWERNEAD